MADPDHELRVAAHERARALQQRYDDLVPLSALREGFIYEGRRISFGSFYKGIHRPKEMRGQAALALVTAARCSGKVSRASTAPRSYGRETPQISPIRSASRCVFERFSSEAA